MIANSLRPRRHRRVPPAGRRARQALEAEFVARLRARWRRGAEAYGDESFDRPLAATVAELLAEVEDVAGWSFVLWVQLQRRLQRITAAGAELPAQEPRHQRRHRHGAGRRGGTATRG